MSSCMPIWSSSNPKMAAGMQHGHPILLPREKPGEKKNGVLEPFRVLPIVSVYAIYGDIYHQYTPNVSIYTSTMDPMGYTKVTNCWICLTKNVISVAPRRMISVDGMIGSIWCLIAVSEQLQCSIKWNLMSTVDVGRSCLKCWFSNDSNPQCLVCNEPVASSVWENARKCGFATIDLCGEGQETALAMPNSRCL